MSLLLCSTPHLMTLERSPNWPKVYADNLSSKGITNLTDKTEKNGTVGAFDKAGNVDAICILLEGVDPTAEKLYRSDRNTCPLLSSLASVESRVDYKVLLYTYKSLHAILYL